MLKVDDFYLSRSRVVCCTLLRGFKNVQLSAGLGFFNKNMFVPNFRFKLIKNDKNQNAVIMGWYKKHLFSAAAVHYHQQKTTSVRLK